MKRLIHSPSQWMILYHTQLQQTHPETGYPAVRMLNLLKKVKLNYEDKKKVFSLLIIEHAFQELVLHRGLALRGKRNTFREDVNGAKNCYRR